MAGGRRAAMSSRTRSPAPQWSPGLMAGGRPPIVFYAKKVKVPQWSPGLMAGGRSLNVLECAND